MKLNFERFKNTVIELLSIYFIQEVGKITQTITLRNILTYFGWVFSSLNWVLLS
jgi:hypothetical protein